MFPKQPVSKVQWIDIDKIEANDYNPNSVAQNEMSLLYLSIKNDGYTQPIVTIKKGDQFVIVDGFHRYLVMKNYQDIYDRTEGKLPIVVIDKDIKERMASTIRHNRARGKHSVKGMASLVFSMLEEGWEDAQICKELGMEAEELIRLKHVTGFSKLFENTEYNKAWTTRRQIKLEKKFKEEGLERFRAFINRMSWREAKTWAITAPHSYIMKVKIPEAEKEPFMEFCNFIRQFGYKKMWWKREFTYVDIDGYKYWCMDDDVGINREVKSE